MGIQNLVYAALGAVFDFLIVSGYMFSSIWHQHMLHSYNKHIFLLLYGIFCSLRFGLTGHVYATLDILFVKFRYLFSFICHQKAYQSR